MNYFEKKTIRRCEREEGFFSDLKMKLGFFTSLPDDDPTDV